MEGCFAAFLFFDVLLVLKFSLAAFPVLKNIRYIIASNEIHRRKQILI